VTKINFYVVHLSKKDPVYPFLLKSYYDKLKEFFLCVQIKFVLPIISIFEMISKFVLPIISIFEMISTNLNSSTDLYYLSFLS
jgi:hypothetical protein